MAEAAEEWRLCWPGRKLGDVGPVMRGSLEEWGVVGSGEGPGR